MRGAKLTYANVMATIAVFLALGGAAVAVTKAPKNSVTSRSIKESAVRGKDVKNDSLKGVDIDESSLSLTLAEPQMGPSGPQGPAGATGPQGPTGEGDGGPPTGNACTSTDIVAVALSAG